MDEFCKNMISKDLTCIIPGKLLRNTKSQWKPKQEKKFNCDGGNIFFKHTYIKTANKVSVAYTNCNKWYC